MGGWPFYFGVIMSTQHSAIADGDRHEVKGASSATANTVCTSNGDGTTKFAVYDYSNLSGKPTLGTASSSSTTDFATAAQGTKADNALSLAGGEMTGPLKLMTYTLASLPSVTTYNRYLIIVTDASAGPALCISNGTNWIDIRTNATVA